MYEYDRDQVARASPSPADDAYAITPADTDLAAPVRALYVTGAGNLVITTRAGTARTIPVPADFMFPCGVLRVAAATTATGIIGFI
jgi:hypothetical protein